MSEICARDVGREIRVGMDRGKGGGSTGERSGTRPRKKNRARL